MALTLDQIALRHGTDKSSGGHNYTWVYEHLFGPWRREPVALLELGVLAGQSLQTWAEYFTHPDALIVGIDNTQGALNLPARVVKYAADQAEIPPELCAWRPNIVIDDASHLSSKTIASFRIWFPRLKAKGVYVVEDVSTSYTPDWSGHHEASEDPARAPAANLHGQTAMQFFKRLADEVQSFALKPEYQLGFDVAAVCFYPDLVIVRKK